MTDEERATTWILQYQTAIQHLRGPVTPERYEDMVAFILGRDGLEDMPKLARKVHALDLRFADALTAADAEWWRRIIRISVRTEVYPSPWWQNILRMAVEEPEELKKAVGH